MTNIISIENKRHLSERKKQAILKKRKVLAVQKLLQCTRCSLKCEKCGTQISDAQLRRDQSGLGATVPYRFCEGCSEEYGDYIDRLKGGGNSEWYWHNDAWLEGWRLWIDYQGATDRYIKSKEFKLLLEELRNQ